MSIMDDLGIGAGSPDFDKEFNKPAEKPLASQSDEEWIKEKLWEAFNRNIDPKKLLLAAIQRGREQTRLTRSANDADWWGEDGDDTMGCSCLPCQKRRRDA